MTDRPDSRTPKKASQEELEKPPAQQPPLKEPHLEQPTLLQQCPQLTSTQQMTLHETSPQQAFFRQFVLQQTAPKQTSPQPSPLQHPALQPSILRQSGVQQQPIQQQQLLPASGEPSQRLPCPAARVCGVCGDRAKSYHFGGISCDSCKAFFRRSVQNEARFTCPYQGRCHITLTSRKSCQACRFAKCLSIGMEASWVMSEQERRARMQQRQAPQAARTGDGTKPLTSEDVLLLEELVNAHTTGCAMAPFAERLFHDQDRSRTELLDLFFTLIHQLSGFAQELDAFCRVPEPHRQVLLRTSVLELCFLRSAFTFDGDRWSSRTLPGDGPPVPALRTADVERLVQEPLWSKHRDFLVATRRLKPDGMTLLLLSAITLLCPDRAGLEDLDIVSKEQEKYCALLRRYLEWRKVPQLVYAKLLMRLPELRELADAHTDSDLTLDNNEALAVQGRLSDAMVAVSSGVGRPEQMSRWRFPGDLLSSADVEEESAEESAEESSEGSDMSCAATSISSQDDRG
ncbi:nuclear receptor subfamily 1 group I member 3 [Ixodes scapularis]|uniref:nuclear receptor subfamily 1 group I member 3 n=1 Tax=Ixodes scapularis TaxID=6945 RepID=UPI001AD781AA|nr:nuclear receptor subfamily 1 group I member 3 [Ixodes scapularis]